MGSTNISHVEWNGITNSVEDMETDGKSCQQTRIEGNLEKK